MAMVQIPMSELKRLDALVLEQRRMIKQQEEMIGRTVELVDQVLLIIHKGRYT